MEKTLATINPYWLAFHLVRSRMRWDFNPKSRISRSRLHQLQDRHSGEKAVIVCNGPSLLRSDLTLLDGIYTFGLNKINLLFDKSSFRPSCIVAVNKLVLAQNKDFYNKTDIPLFLDEAAIDAGIEFNKNVVLFHSVHGIRLMAGNCSVSINQGNTVTFVAMQLALHMGFSRVALIGCDHSFATKGPPNKTVAANDVDRDHFDPNYFSHGVTWQLPDLTASELAYSLAKTTYENAGRQIVNSTEGGKLEIFERMPLADFLSQP